MANFVAKLNELTQKKRLVATYEDVDFVGPDHMRTFSIKVVIGGKAYPEGVGKTKKEAKNNAAKNAYIDLMDGSANATGDGESTGTSRQDETSKHDVAEICDRTTGLKLKTIDNSFKKRDFKGIINNYCQKKALNPTYKQNKSGPPHNPQFFVRLVIGDKEYPEGVAKTVKEAEQKAAELAWEAFQEQSDWDSKVSMKSTGSENGGTLDTASSAAQIPYESTKLKRDEAKGKNMRNGQNEMSTQPRFLTDFEPLERLGSGAFGGVWKARHKVLKKDFAVKIVLCRDKKSFEEVGTLSDMQHENIIRYFNCWMDNAGYPTDNTDYSNSYSQSLDLSSAEYLYIQMELCPKTLRTWIIEKNSPTTQDSQREKESLDIFQEIVTGVEYIHSKGHIHRDLKPENIMFGLDGKVKIGDFGLVTKDDVGYPLIERTNERGTPTYMAPEQFDKKYNRKVDIFALGLIFLELLWKMSAGHERGKIMQEAKYQMLPKEFSQTFFQESKMIVMMLSKMPKNRPEARELKAELRKLNLERDSLQQNLTV